MKYVAYPLLFIQLFIVQIAFSNLLVVTPINHKAVIYVGNTNPANGAMQLELLKKEGLQKNHYVLEIGCGALIAGISIMSFLQKGHYVGIDPNKWLIDDTLKVGENQKIVNQKQPTFLYNSNFDAREAHVSFDYIISHSIISHAAHWQLPLFLNMCAHVLKEGGKVIFSLRLTEPNEFGNSGAPNETKSNDWVYPDNSFFHKKTVIAEASKWFRKVEQKKIYTQFITSTDRGACHDWFVLTK